MPITDLTGTMWKWNYSTSQEQCNFYPDSTDVTKLITFSSNGESFSSMSFYRSGDGDENIVNYGSAVDYAHYIWYSDADGSEYDFKEQYRIFTIIGGTDAQNAQLIGWITDNATQILPVYTYDLTQLSLSVGDYSITAIAKKTGYRNSLASNSVSYEVGHHITISNSIKGDFEVYDGNNESTGILLGSGDGVYAIGSGYMLIDSDKQIASTGTTSGGIVYTPSLSDDHNAVFTVIADGSITYGDWNCMIEGTKITLADRTTKNIEDITYDDELLVWDFYKGEFGTAKPMWIAQEKIADYYYQVDIEGGTTLNLVGSNGKSHRLYDYEDKQFNYPQDMGRHHTIDQNCRGLHIENITKIDNPVKYYNIITNDHYNLYAEGILTSCRLSNRYGIAQPFSRTLTQMKYDLDDVRMTEEEVQEYISKLDK